MDDEHVLAFIKAVHRTDFDAVHQLALDAAFVDNVGHGTVLTEHRTCILANEADVRPVAYSWLQPP
jgi:limonene-1,2-epoxide hydrolase